jgi:hypothetical protein
MFFALTLLLPPSGWERVNTTYEWCACGQISNVTVWDGLQREVASVSENETLWLNFSQPQAQVLWSCNDALVRKSREFPVASSLWEVQLTRSVRRTCAGPLRTGRVRLNLWQPVKDAQFLQTSVAFSSQSEGYACAKIPVLLRTANKTLIAFAEARKENCSDFAQTDLVYRRSMDDGQSWSRLQLLVAPSGTEANGLCNNPLVVGNAAPVCMCIAPYEQFLKAYDFLRFSCPQLHGIRIAYWYVADVCAHSPST